jgi:hypothetical protein
MEFDTAITLLAQKTPGYRVPQTPAEFNSPFNALCRRVHGMRLRAVLVEGYELKNAALRARLFLLRTNANTMRVRVNNEGLKYERAIGRAEEEIRGLDDQLQRNEARLRELRGGGP